MHVINVLLKQHTPIIHFQSKVEEKPLLRGTEIKARFDRYLWKKIKDLGDYTICSGDLRERNSKDFIKYNKALDYRLRIEMMGNSDDINKESLKKNNGERDKSKYTAYFADLGEDTKNNNEEYIIYGKGLRLHFTTFNEKLANKIRENIVEFFCLNNFAKRNSKGFGSFTVSKIDGKKISDDECYEELKKVDSMVLTFDKGSKGEKLLNPSYKLYQILKSGNNHNGYIPSFLMKKYMLGLKGFGNEKCMIKKELFTEDELNKICKKYKKPNPSNEPLNRENSRYSRAMLGLCDGVNFCNNSYKIKYNLDKNNIKRFKSPILIKIIENKVYFIANEINENMYDTNFTMSREENDKRFEIRTPKKEEFDLKELLKEFVKEIKKLKDEKNTAGENFNKIIKLIPQNIYFQEASV